jgi:DNA-binding CsgD family transcriptional regulator
MKHLLFLIYVIILAAGISVLVLQYVVVRNSTNRRIRFLLVLSLVFTAYSLVQAVDYYLAVVVGIRSTDIAVIIGFVHVAMFSALNALTVKFFCGILFERPSGVPLFFFRVAIATAPPVALIVVCALNGGIGFIAHDGFVILNRVETVIIVAMFAIMAAQLVRIYRSAKNSNERTIVLFSAPIIVVSSLFLAYYFFAVEFFLRERIFVGYGLYLIYSVTSAFLIRRYVFDERVRKTDAVKIILHSRAERTALVSYFSGISLTAKERTIAHLLIKGLANEEIAHEEDTNVLTVKKHVTSILRKAAVQSRIELVRKIWEALA